MDESTSKELSVSADEQLLDQGRSQGVLGGAEHPQLHLAEPVL